MSGASERTRRVHFVNLNWNVRPDLPATVEALVVTEDEVRHTVPLRTDEVTGFLTMVAASPVLLFDPDGPSIVAANVVGTWLPVEWSGLGRS